MSIKEDLADGTVYMEVVLSLDDDKPGVVKFLLGENGSGKSFRLNEIISSLQREKKHTIAISNTVFDRFPKRSTPLYACLSPSRGRNYVLSAFKAALISTEDEYRDTLSKIGKVLDYAGFAPLVRGTIRLGPRALETSIRSFKAVHQTPGLSAWDADLVAKLIEDLTHDDTPDWSSVFLYGSVSDYRNSYLLTMLRNEKILKKAGLLDGISLRLERGGRHFDMLDASSGELSLIATYAFLSAKIREGTYILIDEPENSLHPRWQSEYCRHLMDQFYLYGPNVFIASHSPIVLSGAEANDIQTQAFTYPWDRPLEQSTHSIDAILLEAFGVLPPASHYLSEKITSLLNELMYKKITLQEVQEFIRSLIGRSYENRQKEFLEAALDLAVKVDNESTAGIKDNQVPDEG